MGSLDAAVSRARRDPSDGRTADQVRVDAISALFTDAVRRGDQPIAQGTAIRPAVVVRLETLLGLDDLRLATNAFSAADGSCAGSTRSISRTRSSTTCSDQAAIVSSLCRTHHDAKTSGAWSVVQLPDDGSIERERVWTSPTGHTYSTRPDQRARHEDPLVLLDGTGPAHDVGDDPPPF